ncbi:MAG: 23S rRNA pseudouridine(2604) synthase RluF [Bacteroidetes bacterium]|nr:23S rRNA pseudouridine(2604) synthase RluF [Bacteroidota bacterium]HET6243619.1 23S rRNA pseudouridine(2604) synthase RluF [Bacteroidia bacterium]
MLETNSEQKRINKYISETGICSRRAADKLIEETRVTVNGITAVMGTKVTTQDLVEIDGIPVKQKKEPIYIAFNKPPGITSTTDSKDKDNIIDYINFPERIFPVGRLDKPSEGLIFLTNDGDIVNKILRAKNNHEKEYVVTVNKLINHDFIKKMGNGLPILDTITQKCKVVKEGEYSFRIILTQGLNRQIRRMCDFLGYQVIELVRIRIMNITLSGLKHGEWRYLTSEEIKVINKLVQYSAKTQDASFNLNTDFE